jgi:hypothetical protein
MCGTSFAEISFVALHLFRSDRLLSATRIKSHFPLCPGYNLTQSARRIVRRRAHADDEKNFTSRKASSLSPGSARQYSFASNSFPSNHNLKYYEMKAKLFKHPP